MNGNHSRLRFFWKGTSVGFVALLMLGCTHMDRIVTEVRFNETGDLVLTKCDAQIYWNFYFVAWGKGDCSEEVKRKPPQNSK